MLIKLAVVAAASLFAFYANALSLSSVMEPYEKQHCFYMNVEDIRNTLSFYYSESVTKVSKQAGQANSSPARLVVYNPSGQLIQEHPPKSVLEVKVTPSVPGRYAFCLQHAPGSAPVRKVFDVDVSEHTPESNVPGGYVVGEGNDAKAGNSEADQLAQKLERVNVKLKTDLQDMSHTFRYLKNREKRNMETVQEATSRIWWFSVIECLLVVGMAVLQVTILKQLFGTGSRPRV